VSSGKVQAKVKVCRTIEEASSLIEPGDILVTHGTDIGWSPFFPILGGIVTELGGLISHGTYRYNLNTEIPRNHNFSFKSTV